MRFCPRPGYLARGGEAGEVRRKVMRRALARAAKLAACTVALTLLVAVPWALAATFTGTDGADSIRGTEEADTVYALGGDDVVLGEFATDDVGAGDLLVGGPGDDRMFGNIGEDDMRGGAGGDTLQGNVFDDTLYGGDGPDTLMGGSQDDTVFGGRGDDTVKVSFADRVDCGPGTDTVYYSDELAPGTTIAEDCERLVRR